VASPSYLKDRELPQKPQDLLSHRLLTFSYWKPENSWTFVHKNGRDTETLTFQPHLSMNDFAGLAPALVAGAGIGDLPPVVQPSLIEEGRLIEVMPDWRFRTYDLSLVHVGNRHLSKPCRLFKEFAVQMSPTLFPNLPT
jgi:DNA-binding transcriptional LysR family regulator